MAKSLIIVESPAKARTIKKYLGKGFTVIASMGHVKDLPKSRLGVDVDNGFEPRYMTIRAKKSVIENIKKKAKGMDTIFIASDPDREGEAIAWHVAEILGGQNDRIKRVLFNEITKKGIQSGMNNPRTLDKNLYEAQLARRVLDRLVGYKLSPLLWSKVQKRLSAGRVQSIALKLVCDREKEINAFTPVEYWSVTARFRAREEPLFNAKLIKIDGEKAEIKVGEDAETIVRELKGSVFEIVKVKRKVRRRNPQPPFTTSKLQQESSKILRFPASKTMRVAQGLYEGVEIGKGEVTGLITYMRTDSVRVAGEALTSVRKFISETFGGDYLPKKSRSYRNRRSAQDAHEAIRPTDVFITPDSVRKYLDNDQFRMYKLIWDRFVASQMASARYDHTTVDTLSGSYLFRSTGQVPLFNGYLEVYEEAADNGKEEEKVNLPPLEEGEKVDLVELTPAQHFTQPPPRFSESSLIKTLEERGIGRPSTYAAIIKTIKDRMYVRIEDRKFFPSELGMVVSDLLSKNFPRIMDVKFTANMEEELDRIGEGTIDWRDAVGRFYEPFELDLERAKIHMEMVKDKLSATGIPCDLCGGEMVIRMGRNGRFLACNRYPECKQTHNFTEGKNGDIEILRDEPSGVECDVCGKEMYARKWRGGRYLVCSGAPECENKKPYPVGVDCPSCGKGEMVERVSRRGKLFYSCSEYPGCTFASWKEPVNRECPECGSRIMLKRKLRKGGTVLQCMVRGCGGKLADDA